ncbi:DUF2218 domain-containing protein [Terasakiella pusilla]|uniref:DUF2218 domain-containing protein n=1 Tax=Terasakiella pusilla TaxID=64973 RepID=UPI003AA9AA35
MIGCHAIVKTEQASKYLQQLCKHFSHKIEVEYTPTAGLIKFPPAFCELKATPDSLTFYFETESTENQKVYQDVLESHLVRFAHKETLSFVWKEGAV